MRPDNSSSDNFALRHHRDERWEEVALATTKATETSSEPSLHDGGAASSWCSQSAINEMAKRCQHPSLKWKNLQEISYRTPFDQLDIVPLLPPMLHIGIVSTSLINPWSRQTSEARQTSPHPTEVGPFPSQLPNAPLNRHY